MSDPPPAGETKRTLRALATRRVSDDDSAHVVDEATDALTSVDAAVRFLAAAGEERLTRAVVRAVRDDDAETVSRGRRALAAHRRLAVALHGEERPAKHNDTPSRERDANSSEEVRDHFHRARGTVLGGRGERPRR